MKMTPKNNCPLHNFEPCKELDCGWFVQVRGQNPNTGEELDNWSCAVSWIPILLIDNSQQQRQTGAAIESFRNEVVKGNQVTQEILVAAHNQNLIGVNQ
jgi:hypothetical protein